METGVFHLADLSGDLAPFTLEELDYRLPCTKTQYQTCQIIRHLSIWNEWLCYVGLELREVPETGGQLSVVSVSEHYTGVFWELDPHMYDAATLVYWLLRAHHCIVAFDVGEEMASEDEALLCDALQCNTSILTLRLLAKRIESHNQLCSAIARLVHLNVLEHTAAKECPVALVASLSKLVLTTTSLTVLRIPQLRMHGQHADMLLRVISTNRSLRDLSLYFCIINDASQSCRDEFADFLKNDCCLTALEICGGDLHSERCLAFVLDCLLDNRTLTKVDLKYFCVDQATAELVPKVVAENVVLRSFNLTQALMDLAGTPKAIFDSWLLAFAENETLEETTLPLRICELDRWQTFLRTLAGKRNTRKLTIDARGNEQTNLRTLCRRLHQYGVVDRVSLGSVIMCDSPDMLDCKTLVYVVCDSLDMLECEAFREVIVASSYGGPRTVPLLNIIPLLSSLSHITSVHLEIKSVDLDAGVTSTIADYVQASRTLKKLHMSSWPEEPRLARSEHHWKPIFESLSKNSSIKELGVYSMHLSSEEMHSLANAVLLSQSIRTCDFAFGKELDWIDFVRALGGDIANNYSITNASLWVCRSDPEDRDADTWQFIVEQWFDVMDTARRNASLVSRAAQFLSGPRCDRYCFSALEQVYQHPPLLEHLAEVMSLSVSDTRSMVRDALRSVQDMHGFMRVAGVVRDRVVCRPRQDDHMQLDDLNEHCWTLISRFLKLEDVLIDSATSP